MNLTIEQLAEILAGIAKSQQAIIEAVESQHGGFKNTHLLPKINSAANMRFAIPRLIDVPARVLMRSQGRNVMDVDAVTRMLHEAISGEAVPAVTSPTPAAAIATRTAPAAAVPAAAAAGAVAGAVAATPAATESKPAAGGDDLSNFFDT